MKRLTYGSIFDGLDDMSSAARELLDFIVLRTAESGITEYKVRVYLREFMKWRGSTNEAASRKRVETAIHDLLWVRLRYRGNRVARIPIKGPDDYVTTYFQIGEFNLCSGTYRRTWNDDGDNNPYALVCICTLFFACLIYEAATKEIQK